MASLKDLIIAKPVAACCHPVSGVMLKDAASIDTLSRVRRQQWLIG